MNRAGFIRSLILGAGAIAVGPKIIDEFERLTHKKVFALGAIPGWTWVHLNQWHEAHFALTEAELASILASPKPDMTVVAKRYADHIDSQVLSKLTEGMMPQSVRWKADVHHDSKRHLLTLSALGHNPRQLTA